MGAFIHTTKINQTETNQTETNQTETNQTETKQPETNQTKIEPNQGGLKFGFTSFGGIPVAPTNVGINDSVAFQQAQTRTNSCFGPPPPSNPTGGFMGLGCVQQRQQCQQRHPETGLPIPPTNTHCFGLPRVINNTNTNTNTNTTNTEDKKKYIESIYTELSMIRQQVDKLNKSIDALYEHMRHI